MGIYEAKRLREERATLYRQAQNILDNAESQKRHV
jgi:hypothetical protein